MASSWFLCPFFDSGAYSFWSVCLSAWKTFNIGHNFWMVRDGPFIFHMYNPYYKSLPLACGIWGHSCFTNTSCFLKLFLYCCIVHNVILAWILHMLYCWIEFIKHWCVPLYTHFTSMVLKIPGFMKLILFITQNKTEPKKTKTEVQFPELNRTERCLNRDSPVTALLGRELFTIVWGENYWP